MANLLVYDLVIEEHTRTNGEVILSERDFTGVVSVAISAFGAGMTASEVKEHVLPVDFLYITRHKQEIIGFASLVFGEGNAYLAGTVIASDFQGKGMYRELALIRIRKALREEKSILTTRTQNPRVEHTLTKALEELVVKAEIKKFTIEREHVQGVYGRMLTPSQPYSSEERINELYRGLNYPAGDAFKLRFEVKK